MATSKLWKGKGFAGAPGAPAPGGGVLSTDWKTDASIVVRGVGGMLLRRIGSVRAGYAFNSSNQRYIAFVDQYGRGEDEYDEWTMYLWDSSTGRLRAVGHNPVDAHGRALRGYYVHPVLSQRYLYWIQAAPDIHHLSDTSAGSEIVQYNLTTARSRVLYDGVAAALVPYGKEILFTAVPPGPKRGSIIAADGSRKMVVRAIDQSTGKEIPAPVGLTAGADGAFQMVTNGDVVAWNQALGTIGLWRPAWRRAVSVGPSETPLRYAGLTGVDSLGFFKQFLTFRGNGQAWVLDVGTGGMATFPSPVSVPVFGADHLLTLWQSPYVGNTAPPYYTAYLLDLAKLPDLPSCHGGR